MKGSLMRIAMDYMLNQWNFLIGYCVRGDLQISNVLAENAIRQFAIGRKVWLVADTSRGACASATCLLAHRNGQSQWLKSCCLYPSCAGAHSSTAPKLKRSMGRAIKDAKQYEAPDV